MAITTYAEIQAAVANWANRTDLTSEIPDFVTLCEERINAKLRCREMVARITSPAAEYMGLPDNWVEAREVKLTTDRTIVLDYYSPIAIDKQFPDDGAGQPSGFTIIGPQIRLLPPPSGTYTVEIAYYQRLAALSDSNTTNTILERFPRIYLFGCLVELNNFVMDTPSLQRYEALFDEAITTANAADQAATHAGGTLRVTLGSNVV
jgi:hypothetical protein